MPQLLYDSEALRRIRGLVEDLARNLQRGSWMSAQADLVALDDAVDQLRHGVDALAEASERAREDE